MTRFWLLLVVNLLLQGTSITVLTTQVQAQNNTTPKKTTPTQKRSRVKFKPPKGQPKPKMAIGGGRRNNGMCEQSGIASHGIQNRTMDKTLVPLLPSSKLGLTASSHPSFMVYVPATSARVLEFTFYNQQEQGIYQTRVNINNTPGIVNFSLPTTAPGLEIGKDYRFVVSIICQKSG
ncbi:MAG: DUF928 domain-containing protein, partial [Cyanobacteria bacterium P01_D01_bin.116]